MLKYAACLMVSTALLSFASRSMADSPSDLLEKGIYTEETVGDLDTAIKIYQEIISQDEGNRKFVAQAQLRLGRCLIKKGKRKEAEEVLRKLVDEFEDETDQKELVEKARELLPASAGELQLDPVPWVDGEYLELRIKLGGGLDVGVFILSAQSGEEDGREVWHLKLNRNIAVNAPNLGLSHLVADRRTFRPIHSLFRHSLLGNTVGEYAPKKVTIRAKGNDGKESIKHLDLDGVYYDNEQGWQMFRRLALAKDYTGKMPICATFGGGPMMLDMEVMGTESIEVPAGKFECYKLFVKPVQQTFWISTDAHRYPVKFEAGGVTGELRSIRQVKPDISIEFADDDLGFSFSAPADWYFIPDASAVKEPARFVMLVDPNAEGINAVVVKPLDQLKADFTLAQERLEHYWAQQASELARTWRDDESPALAFRSCVLGKRADSVVYFGDDGQLVYPAPTRSVTPLSSIRLLVDTLLDEQEYDVEKVREYLEMVAKENNRLSRLIGSFLTFSRMERNKHAFEFAEIQVTDVVDADVEVPLTTKEFRTLEYFVRRPGRALTRHDIMDTVWGSLVIVTARSVDRCINTLRGKIEPDPRHPTHIRTIRDIGYRFEDDP